MAFPHPRSTIKYDVPGTHAELKAYTGVWSSAVQADEKGFTAELAIPWKTLADVGFDRDTMMVDLSSRGPLRRAPVMEKGFERVLLVPQTMAAPRRLSLRLHFAEIEDAQPGERVFDVKVQGKVVLKDFDIVEAAGGANRAVVKDVNDVVASRAIVLDLVPKAKLLTPSTAPILSGIEILPSGK